MLYLDCATGIFLHFKCPFSHTNSLLVKQRITRDVSNVYNTGNYHLSKYLTKKYSKNVLLKYQGNYPYSPSLTCGPN